MRLRNITYVCSVDILGGLLSVYEDVKSGEKLR